MAITFLPAKIALAATALLCFAAGYGALSAVVPLIVLKCLLVVLGMAIGFSTFRELGPKLWLTVPAGVLCGAGAAVLIWAGWFWVEQGQAAALDFVTAGPRGMFKRITIMAQDSTYTFSRRGSSTVVGPMMLAFLWWGQTLVFGLAPVAGALAGRFWPEKPAPS